MGTAARLRLLLATIATAAALTACSSTTDDPAATTPGPSTAAALGGSAGPAQGCPDRAGSAPADLNEVAVGSDSELAQCVGAEKLVEHGLRDRLLGSGGVGCLVAVERNVMGVDLVGADVAFQDEAEPCPQRGLTELTWVKRHRW